MRLRNIYTSCSCEGYSASHKALWAPQPCSAVPNEWLRDPSAKAGAVWILNPLSQCLSLFKLRDCRENNTSKACRCHGYQQTDSRCNWLLWTTEAYVLAHVSTLQKKPRDSSCINYTGKGSAGCFCVHTANHFLLTSGVVDTKLLDLFHINGI